MTSLLSRGKSVQISRDLGELTWQLDYAHSHFSAYLISSYITVTCNRACKSNW